MSTDDLEMLCYGLKKVKAGTLVHPARILIDATCGSRSSAVGRSRRNPSQLSSFTSSAALIGSV
jgi:hypothetical protein